MALDLKDKKGSEYDDDWKPAEPAVDPLEEQSDAPSASSANLPPNHPDRSKLSPDELKSSENESGFGNTEIAAGTDDNAIPYKEEQSKLKFLQRVGPKKPKKKSKAKKRALFAGAMGGGGLLIGVLLVLLLLNALKIQNLAQHVLEYNMVRAARSFRLAAEDTVSDRLVIDGVENSANAAEKKGFIDALHAKYGNLRSQTWGKFDKFRPTKVLENLQSTGELKFIYKETPRKILPGTKLELQRVIVGEQSIDVAQTSRFNIFKNAGERIRFSSELDTALSKAVPESPNLIRSRAAKLIQKDLGIKLFWWEKLGKKFSGLSEKDAFKLEQQKDFGRIRESPNTDSLVPQTNDQAKSADEEVTTKVKDGTAPETDLGYTQAKDAADATTAAGKDVSGNLPDGVIATAIENATKGSIWRSALETLSTTYQIALPVCMIFDGSTVHPDSLKSSIDSKNASLQKSFYGLESADNQQKAGATTGEAVGSFSDKLGNIKDSPPELRAAGKNVDTSQFAPNAARPQAGPTGDATIANVIFGNKSVVTDIANKSLGDICPLLLDIRFAALEAAVEAAVALASGGSEEAVAKTTSEGATKAAEVVAAQVIKQSIFKRGVGIAKKLGRDVILWGGITILAKLMVLSHMNGNYNGLSTGKDFATETDMGGNLHANELQRQGLYGRPLTAEEVQVTHQADVADLVHNEQVKSFNQRYFALSNANSLLSRMGFALQNSLGNLRTIVSWLPKVLNPMRSLASTASNLGSSQKLHAQQKYGSSDNYGIIQWGWSEDELAKIQNDQTYSIVENAEIVERDPDLYKKIEDDYGDCFTKSLGTIISEQWVQTDAKGDVVPDSGKCSPQNLGINNPKYHGAVFRWRLKKRYDYVLDHLSEIQDAQAQPTTVQGAI